MTNKQTPDDTSTLLDSRFYFGHYTPDRGCGGTDGDVFLQLIGPGVEYPAPGRWYILDNSGNDRERGDWDSYWLESGSMRAVHTCRLYFVPKGSAPAWEISECSLNRMTKDPITGRWQVSEFRNRWKYNRCLETEGWYTSVDVGFQPVHTRAADLLTTDPDLFNSVVALTLLSDQQDMMGLRDKRSAIVPIPHGIDVARDAPEAG
ncbi:MAG: hypothetical protein KDA85_04365 [Planctomycetaceae bacterium]|nr:hypothetical protein [Planctomycetaceae bacterium]